MADNAHDETDRLIAELEKKIRREYEQAEKETEKKLASYLKKFEAKDKAWQAQVAAGEKTAEAYAKWRTSQIMVGESWESLKRGLASDLHDANVLAQELVTQKLAGVYAENFNYATYLIEKNGKVDTSFSLYNKDAVNRILRENPELLPQLDPEKLKQRIEEGKDILWQKGQIQSVTLQSILQGESIPNMAKRIAKTMGVKNTADATRYARTAMTSAQNSGRQDAFERAEQLGIKLKKQWISTLDDRTRHEHRLLDGQIKEVDEPFEVEGEEIMYPGDEAAEPYLVYNCRCTMISKVDGWEDKSGQLRSTKDIGDYDEWKYGKSKNEEAEPPRETATAVDGSNISGTWERRAAQFDFEIEDVINAQGFDGLPRVVSQKEFDAAVKAANGGEGFIAQRTYSAPTQETLDAYREQLYNGKWYVDCSTGGAQYGQGMYCAADYTGKLSDGINAEMSHYIELNQKRHENNLNFMKSAGVDISEIPTTVPHYIETMTLDPSANIVTYDHLQEIRGYGNFERMLLDEADVSEKDKSVLLEWIANEGYVDELPLALQEIGGELEYKAEQMLKMDNGSLAALLGYDAIDARGHGESGSYTVILNRTKVIILGG